VSTLRSISACAALFIVLTRPLVALAAPTREACVEAYEQSQVAIKRGELSKGRDLVRVCLDSACPPRLQADCATWLTEIETKQPTIVVSYKDRRSVQRTDVEVFVDGKSVATKLDGRGIAVEPGAHTIRIQPTDDQPMEEKRVVREGVKLDPVEFSRAVKAAPTRIVLPPERPIPTSAFIAGGVGVLGLAGFTTFAILGKTAQNELDNTCVPNCSDSEVSKVRSRYLIADISLAVGVVGLTSAVLLYAFRPEVEASSADGDRKSPGPTVALPPNAQLRPARRVAQARGWWAPDVQAVPGGGMLGLQGTWP
jgi:hypothetical protein